MEPRPPRPVLVELAAAVLIIGSAMDVFISFEGTATAPTAEGRLLFALSTAIGAALVVLGLLVRAGRAWIVAINVVAVAAFLEITSLTFAGLVSMVLDLAVLVILLRERWWFQWRPPEDPSAAATNGLSYERGRDA